MVGLSVDAPVPEFDVGRFGAVGRADYYVAGMVRIDDYFPHVGAVDVGAGHAAVLGVERIWDVFLKALYIVVEFGDEVEAVSNLAPTEGGVADVQIAGVG